MGLQPVKTSGVNGIPVYQRVNQVAQGGCILTTTGLVADSILPAGTPLKINEATRAAVVSKTFTAQANATDTATEIRINKDSQAVVGTIIAKTAGSKAYAITAIDKTNAAYDALTIGTTLGAALTSGDVLFESSAAGATAAAILNTPTGLLQDPAKVQAGEQVNIVLVGTAYERRIPGLITALKDAMKGIIFSQSY